MIKIGMTSNGISLPWKNDHGSQWFDNVSVLDLRWPYIKLRGRISFGGYKTEWFSTKDIQAVNHGTHIENFFEGAKEEIRFKMLFDKLNDYECTGCGSKEQREEPAEPSPPYYMRCHHRVCVGCGYKDGPWVYAEDHWSGGWV